MMDLVVSQIIIQIIDFLVMFWILKRYGWKPILNLLDERRKRIESEFNTIAVQKEEVKNMAEDYNLKLKEIEVVARHRIQEAVMEGRKIAREIQEEAQANAKAILFKAKEDVNKEIAKARNQLKNDLVNMAIATAEKILLEKFDESTHDKLITEFVKASEIK